MATIDTAALLADVKSEGEAILPEVITFVENVALGQPASISYEIPTEKLSQTISVLGRSGTLTEEESDGKLLVTWTPAA